MRSTWGLYMTAHEHMCKPAQLRGISGPVSLYPGSHVVNRPQVSKRKAPCSSLPTLLRATPLGSLSGHMAGSAPPSQHTVLHTHHHTLLSDRHCRSGWRAATTTGQGSEERCKDGASCGIHYGSCGVPCPVGCAHCTTVSTAQTHCPLQGRMRCIHTDSTLPTIVHCSALLTGHIH
jgi:hypothetical protein